METYRLSAIIERDAEGIFAFCPQLQGCFTSGDTYEEAFENLRDAARLHIEDRLADGEGIPVIENIHLTFFEVAV